MKPRVPHGDPRNSDIQSEPDSVEYFRSFCNMLKNDVNELFNYVSNDVLIDDFKYMTVECKWQVMLTDSAYTDFNMWAPLRYKIARECLSC